MSIQDESKEMPVEGKDFGTFNLVKTRKDSLGRIRKINPVNGKMITKPTIYTEEFVEGEIVDILAELESRKDILVLNELFTERPYTKDIYYEWNTQFSSNRLISHSIKRIKAILEERIVVGGLKNKLNVAMAIFNLKNNYGWKDKQEIEHSGGVSLFGMAHKRIKEIEEERQNG